MYGIISYATNFAASGKWLFDQHLGASFKQKRILGFFFSGTKCVLIGVTLGALGRAIGWHSVLKKSNSGPYHPDFAEIYFLLLLGLIVMASIAIIIPSWRSNKV